MAAGVNLINPVSNWVMFLFSTLDNAEKFASLGQHTYKISRRSSPGLLRDRAGSDVANGSTRPDAVH